MAEKNSTRAPDSMPPSLAPPLPASLGDGDIAWWSDDSLVAARAADGALFWWRIGDASWAEAGTLGCGAKDLVSLNLSATKDGLIWRGFDRGRNRIVSGLLFRGAARGCRALPEIPDPWGRSDAPFGVTGSYSIEGDYAELAVGRTVGPIRLPPMGGAPVPQFRVWRRMVQRVSTVPETSAVAFVPVQADADVRALQQQVWDEYNVARWLASDTLMLINIPRAEGRKWFASGGEWRPLPDRIRFPLHMDSYRPVVVPAGQQAIWGDLLTAGLMNAAQRDTKGRWWIVAPGARVTASREQVFLGSDQHGLSVWRENSSECRWYFDSTAGGATIVGVRLSPAGAHVAVRLWDRARGGMALLVWNDRQVGC